jgi:hypothetical protein
VLGDARRGGSSVDAEPREREKECEEETHAVLLLRLVLSAAAGRASLSDVAGSAVDRASAYLSLREVPSGAAAYEAAALRPGGRMVGEVDAGRCLTKAEEEAERPRGQVRREEEAQPQQCWHSGLEAWL